MNADERTVPNLRPSASSADNSLFHIHIDERSRNDGLTDWRREGALPANATSEESGSSKLQRVAAVRSSDLARPDHCDPFGFFSTAKLAEDSPLPDAETNTHPSCAALLMACSRPAS
jgi:hypothetical protein